MPLTAARLPAKSHLVTLTRSIHNTIDTAFHCVSRRPPGKSGGPCSMRSSSSWWCSRHCSRSRASRVSCFSPWRSRSYWPCWPRSWSRSSRCRPWPHTVSVVACDIETVRYSHPLSGDIGTCCAGRSRCVGWSSFFAVSLFAGAVLLLPRLGTEFVPELEEGTINIRVTLAPSTSVNTSLGVAARLEQVLMQIPEVTYASSRIGRRAGWRPRTGL